MAFPIFLPKKIIYKGDLVSSSWSCLVLRSEIYCIGKIGHHDVVVSWNNFCRSWPFGINLSYFTRSWCEAPIDARFLKRKDNVLLKRYICYEIPISSFSDTLWKGTFLSKMIKLLESLEMSSMKYDPMHNELFRYIL